MLNNLKFKIGKSSLILVSCIVFYISSSFLSHLYAEKIDNGLKITGLSEDVLAAPGNKHPNYIILSITDNYGVPIPNLGISNFTLDTMIVGPGGSAMIDISRVLQGKIDGTYLIQVIPTDEETWKSGVYIFVIKAFYDKYQGQILIKSFID